MPNSISNPDVPITKQDLYNFYQKILPYLGAVGSLSELTDVLITSATNGQSIKYNATSGKWENADIIDDTASTAAVAWSAAKVIAELANKQATLTAGAGITITNGVISADPGISMTIVSSLPTQDISTTTIYLVPAQTTATDNIYDEFVYVNNQWEQIGSTAIDLTNLYTKQEINSMFTSQSTSQSAIDDTQDSQVAEIDNSLSSMSTSMSELAETASSLSTENSTQTASINSLTSENSTQTSEINSLSTAESELTSEIDVLESEVAEKQDVLTAGEGIDIEQFGNDTIIKSSGAVIYANALFPSGS